MKKNILLLLMALSFFMIADAHAQIWGDAQDWCDAQECCDEDYCCDDETNFYAKILSGPNFLQKTTNNGNRSSFHTGYIIAGKVGYCWCYGLCLEAEYAYRRNAIRKINFFLDDFSKHGYYQSSSCMANLLWSLPLSSWGCEFWNIQPFIGAGVGYDFQKMHSSNSRFIFNQKWNRFSWQLMTGLTYPIFCNTEISLEYIFHQGGCHFNNHSLGIGLTYKFDLLSF